jgi:dTDP-4-amino-4,6-dideoxygalactose transaminase
VEIGQRHHLPVIEDAACAIGSEILWDGRWEMVGRPHSDIACFSFHPRKVISTGDGGMLTTRHQNYDATFRLLRQHAMSVSDATRHSSPKVIFESYPSVGFNYRLTDIQAAVGREQLKRLPDIVAQRRRLADNYRHLLSHTCGLTLPIEPVWGRSNWQSYAVRMPHDVSQQSVMQYLLDAGVSSRRGIMCAHREQAYADVTLDRPLPHSEAAQDHCVLLPLYPGMSEAEQAHVAATLRAALESTTTPKNFRHQVNIAAFERM